VQGTPLQEEGEKSKMRIGVVSDTHGQVQFAREAAEVLRPFEIQHLIHCGDIGSQGVVSAFAEWPGHYVLGNCDYGADELREAIAGAGQHFHGRFGEFEIAGRRIALLHGDDGAKFRESVASGKFDLVCYGHTHVAEYHREGSTWVLNPGALFRANPHRCAVVDLATMEIHSLVV
jgi:putative phosphoesterase